MVIHELKSYRHERYIFINFVWELIQQHLYTDAEYMSS
jgi:hypothetical protein